MRSNSQGLKSKLVFICVRESNPIIVLNLKFSNNLSSQQSLFHCKHIWAKLKEGIFCYGRMCLHAYFIAIYVEFWKYMYRCLLATYTYIFGMPRKLYFVKLINPWYFFICSIHTERLLGHLATWHDIRKAISIK